MKRMTPEERARLIEEKVAMTQKALYNQVDSVHPVGILTLLRKDSVTSRDDQRDWRIIRVVAVSVEGGINEVPCFEVVPAGPCGRNPPRKFIPLSEVALMEFLHTKNEPYRFVTPLCGREPRQKKNPE